MLILQILQKIKDCHISRQIIRESLSSDYINLRYLWILKQSFDGFWMKRMDPIFHFDLCFFYIYFIRFSACLATLNAVFVCERTPCWQTAKWWHCANKKQFTINIKFPQITLYFTWVAKQIVKHKHTHRQRAGKVKKENRDSQILHCVEHLAFHSFFYFLVFLAIVCAAEWQRGSG